MSASHTHASLVVEWSPSWVVVFDPMDGSSRSGSDLAQAITPSQRGREAVFAIAHRNAFVRVIPVPRVAREDVERVVALKIAPLLPFKVGEFVSGFRLGTSEAISGGSGSHIAVIGAVRSEFLRSIEAQAAAASVLVRAVLPVAFGSWIAAREHSLSGVAVVSKSPDGLCVDIISNGELIYSRSTPEPGSAEASADEIARTCAIAGVGDLPILRLGELDVAAEFTDSKTARERLSNWSSVSRLLFSLELPEHVIARRNRIVRSSAQRGIAAAVAAVAMAMIAYGLRVRDQAHLDTQLADTLKRADAARNHEQVVSRGLSGLIEAKTILDQAFHPAQSSSDVITELSTVPGPSIWLTGLRLETGKPLILRGTGTDGKAIAKYADDLSSDSRFRDVKLLFANKGQIGKRTVVQFAITGREVGSLPIDQVTERPGAPIVKGSEPDKSDKSQFVEEEPHG